MASKTQHAQMWRDLREAGTPIISTWIDEAGPGESASRADLWTRCIAEASRCTALMLYAEEGEVLTGAFVEVGAALAHGARIVVLGNAPRWTFEDHPQVVRVETIVEALQAAHPTELRCNRCGYETTVDEAHSSQSDLMVRIIGGTHVCDRFEYGVFEKVKP